MVKLLQVVGVMGKSEPFYNNHVDCHIQLMMHLYMGVPHQYVLRIVKQLFQQNQKQKSGFGKLESKLKL
ncbi:unnamed protein product [Paramecium pentaurelia]|uniref:Uncharacterized protein n=1 Tax=Paramecium pentaurelia TaxID=43138 RepID=A0A8S1WTP9_9CILI|nr:unnamed protein product [Paramecium pentaurelia]